MARVIQKEKHDSNYRTETRELKWKHTWMYRKLYRKINSQDCFLFFLKCIFPLWEERVSLTAFFSPLYYFSPLIANNGKGKKREKEVRQGRTDGCIRVAPGLVFNFRWESPSLSVRWKKSVKSTFIWKQGKKAREWRRGEKGRSKKINK